MKLTFTRFLLITLGLSLSLSLFGQSPGSNDVILQGFYWNTNPGDVSIDEGVWWDTLAAVAPQISESGFKTVWTPPANKGFAGTFDMGYGVYDYYDFGSYDQKGTVRTRHGNAAELQSMIDIMHQNGLKVMGDIVLNHRAGAEETQPEDCDHNNDGLEDRFTKFRPASGRAPMNAEDFHPTSIHCDLFDPYHNRIFFEDLCYFENLDQVLNPNAPNNGWYFGPHNLGKAGDSLIVWGRYLLDEMGFDELRLDAVKHIEPGFLAPFLVELQDGDQPFAVGELFDGDLGTLKGYHDDVEGFVSNFGTGSKDASIAIFDFNLRFALRDMCNNTGGGFDMWNLNSSGLRFNPAGGIPGEDIVTFVENHDFDRIGYVLANCNDADVVAQEGNTCLKFSTDSGHDPVVFDKHLGYSYIMAAEGRPSVFWKDWFWFGLGEEIEWQMALRSAMSSGGSAPIQNLNPFFLIGNGGDLFVLNRYGNAGQGGLVLAMNDNASSEASAFVNTPFSDTELKDYSDAFMFFQTTAFNDSRAFIKASARNYAWYAPTGHYPQPPGETPTAFDLGSHEGAKLHFVALRAADASQLLVNGAPIEPGDQLAVLPMGSSNAVGLGRIGQSFEWDGVHDMIIEVLGGGNTAEAKGGLLNGEGFRLAVFDKSTGTTEIAGILDFAPNGTNFTFTPRRPNSRGGAFNISTTHSNASYQVGGISLITGFDTRELECVASTAAAGVYDNWQSGDNDGSGFGNWTLSSSGSAGHFTASSAGNGDGDDNSDGDIDDAGRAWGMFANSGGLSEAFRPLNQPLATGETFSIHMDNGFVNGSVGFGLQNSSGENLIEFFFTGGNSNYTLKDASGDINTGLSYTDEGLLFELTLTGTSTYEATISRLTDGSSTSFNGNLMSPVGGQEIARLRLFNVDAGFDAPANLYFNNLQICRLPDCLIASVSAGTQTTCDPANNTYEQEVVVTFNSTPTGGSLSLNGVTEPLNISGGTQTITLTGLVSDGQAVDVTVVLSGSEGCTVESAALFTAPADCQLPSIECPENINVSTDAGLCTALVNYNEPIGTDNLPGANTQRTSGLGSGSNFPLGTTIETYEVTDAAGNTDECSFTITVVDNELPVANCRNTTVDLSPDGSYTLQESDVLDNLNSSDNCEITNINFPAATYTCEDEGMSFTVPLTASDAAGNMDGCDANITVELSGALPPGWTTADIGQVTLGNAYEYDPCLAGGSQFTITGSGNNATSSTTDNVAFASQTICGDGMITAKIESISPNGYGGLMLRETTANGAKQVSIFSNLTNILRHEVRYTSNGPKQASSFYKPNPFWLRLQRQGPWIFAYYSTTGNSFQFVHAVNVSMQSCVEIGLASFTYLPNAQTEAVFSNVSIIGGNGVFAIDEDGMHTINRMPPKEPLNLSTSIPLNLTVYPNPSKDAFTLAFQQPLRQDTEAQLLSTFGEVIQSRILEPGTVDVQWNTEMLPTGTYWLHMQQSNGTPITKRIVVVK